MNAVAKLTRLVLVSPWFLLIFLVIPLLVVLNITLHVRLPLVGVNSLLVNNACFTFLIALRFVRYVAGMGKRVRYDARYGKPQQDTTVTRPIAEARGALTRAGYSFAADGSYGEKRDHGYLGTTLLYGGLLIVLSFGTWDNLRQFSGMLLDGMGPATKLNRVETYLKLSTGPLTEKPDSLPRMQIINQYMPSRTYPHGATEIALIGPDGKEQRKTVKPMEPFSYGRYDISMAKFVVEPLIVIKTSDSKPVFEGLVKLAPVVRKEGAYRFYGPFRGADVDGHVYYQTDTNRLKVMMRRDGKWVLDAELKFQVDQQVANGGFLLSCEKMGKWTEIHVVRRRHMPMIWLGAVVAGIGLLMRLVIKPRRVWLEETAEGCRIRAVGKGKRSSC